LPQPRNVLALPPDLALDQLAIEHKATQCGRKIMSLRGAAGWSGMLGLVA
jgi:hypothetical protein